MNTKKYRHYYARTKEDTDSLRDLDFLGCYHKENAKIVKKGFFNLFHGDKPREIDFLRSQVEIAEDSQAIYEFLQNAVDAEATEFYIFWDKENFLVVNNGNKFREEDISSILNFSQSTKSNGSDERIGKFGIGFKLIHRLVGNDNSNDDEANGLNAITNNYSGPILFSWDNSYIKQALQNNLDSIDNHWLFKILYTNFPSGIDEKIKNKEYVEQVLFPKSHYQEMVNFINKQEIDLELLQQGSIFFLKLGDEKSKLLDGEKENIKHGIKYSLNIIQEFTKKRSTTIKHININNIQVDAEDLSCINTETCTMLFSKNLEQAIIYYHKNPAEKISFFKFFPMGDQINGLNFIIHSDKFHIESNRRKLHKENQDILEKIAADLQFRFDVIKKKDQVRYENILANLYLSDLETANNDKLIYKHFSVSFLEYLKTNIPYKDTNVYGVKSLNTTDDKSEIVIIDSSLHEIPLQIKQHFYFNPKTHKDIVNEAKKKLQLLRWNIVDVMVNDNINSWILELNNNDFNKLLLEIKEKRRLNSQSIVNIWQGVYSLKDIKRILQIFSVLDTNIKFAVLKNKSNNYEILFNSNNLFIKNNDFREFLEKKYELYEMEYYLIPEELEKSITGIIGKNSSDKEILEDLLEENEHKEVIDFIEYYQLEDKFLSTLDRLDINTSSSSSNTSYELKVLDFILKYEDSLEVNKRKVFINNEQVSQLSKSPYLTFTYQSKNSSKVINPNSFNNDKNSEKILSFIEEIGKKYTSIFNIQEESKEIAFEEMKNEIFSNWKLKNRINTNNRLKFILLYSLEKEQNYIKDFNGINIYNHEKKIDESVFRLHKILKNDIKVKDEEQFNIFNISDFFPQIFNNEYYIEDSNLAIIDEKLPNDVDVNYIEMFKKIGLVIDVNLPKFRKKLIEKIDISIDDFKILKSIHLINTCRFMEEKSIEFNFENSDIKNIEKLFKMLDENRKINLDYLPILRTESSFIFQKIEKYASGTYYILKATLKSENKEFQKRLKEEISSKNIIYIDVLDLGNVPPSWIEVKENEEEKINDKALELNSKEKSIDMTLEKSSKDDFEYKWMIGWKGEKAAYEQLIKKFGVDNVEWHNINNRNSKDDKGGIDIEVKDNTGKIIHNIEVKATQKSTTHKDNTVAFYMSSAQYRNAKKYGSDTHLIFVTGIEDDKPEFLYMNFDNSWLN